MSNENKITVLGNTFNSEEECSTYFREELRKKLPDLKKMEGYPIGEDEEILKQMKNGQTISNEMVECKVQHWLSK